MEDVFLAAEARIKSLQRVMNLTDREVDRLLSSEKISHTELEVEGEKIPAWRIIHNNALGPGKGGIRFHPDVSEGEVRSLAFWMALKNSLAGLPYGGGKGGAKFNPKGRSPEFIQKVSRAYVKAFHQVLGPDKDVPAPDVYTNPQVMAWMLDEYEKIIGQHQPAMITGKPIELGGLALRSDSTARGGFIIANELINAMNENKTELTVAIQGFGNAGAHIARMLDQDGLKIIAVSDSRGGIMNENGLDLAEVSETKEREGTVAAYTKGNKISNEELLELKTDILFLAALENQITKENADRIQARYIIELANGPVSPEADEVLWSKKIMVVPDILANSGGVIVSYFEWAQNKVGNLLDEAYLERKLEEMMKLSWSRVLDVFEKKDRAIDLRTSAYVLAVERILSAERLRGNI